MIPTRWDSERGKTVNQLLPGVEGGMNKRNTEKFQGNDNCLRDTILVNMCHYALSKPTEFTTPRVNSTVIHGL